MPATDSATSAVLDTLVREPQQERSRKTLERIAGAGFRLLLDDGPDAVTVTGVAKRARTSVGSFYARFDGREELVRYLGERALADLLGAWVNRDPDPGPASPLAERFRPALTLLLELHRDGPGRALVLLDGVEDPAPSRRSRLASRVVADLAAELDDPDPEARRRTRLALRVLLAFLRDVALGVVDEAEDDSPASGDLASELVSLLSGFLGAPEAGAASTPVPGTDVDPFDVWG